MAIATTKGDKMETTVNDYKKTMNKQATHAVDSIKNAGENFVDSSLGHQIADTAKEYKERTVEFYDSTLERVRANPFPAIAIALGLGVVAGFALRGRK